MPANEISRRQLGPLVPLLPENLRERDTFTPNLPEHSEAQILERVWRFLIREQEVGKFKIINDAVVGTKLGVRTALGNPILFYKMVPAVCYILSANDTTLHVLRSQVNEKSDEIILDAIATLSSHFGTENTARTRHTTPYVGLVGIARTQVAQMPKAVLVEDHAHNERSVLFACYNGTSPLAVLQTISNLREESLKR